MTDITIPFTKLQEILDSDEVESSSVIDYSMGFIKPPRHGNTKHGRYAKPKDPYATQTFVIQMTLKVKPTRPQED
jgi:hypothetical protein